MQDFKGIAEKLKRAEESVHNLYSEMERFFNESDYPTIPDDDRKMALQAIEYHQNLIIPPRFGVLVGEINHHLRSCLDHVIWHFSVDAIHTIKNIRHVEFPIFDTRPTNHDSRALFERKIQGVTNLDARILIERFQPYNAANPLDDPLWIIHDFDIMDKHRELIFCGGTGSIAFPRDMMAVLETYQREHPELDAADVAHHFKSHGTTQPCISFRNFGRRGIKPLTEGLIELFNHTIMVVNEFRIL